MSDVLRAETKFRFHDTFGQEASAWLKTDFGYGTHMGVDPFPAYPHDEAVVRETLARVEAAFPLPEPFSPWFFLLEHEFVSRMNGGEGADFDYGWEPPEDDPRDERHQRPWRGRVALSAKRVPPHPAMTRYLVAHEYGHVVADWLVRGRGEAQHSTTLLEEYADLRGLPPSEFQLHAGGGTWHRSIQEIFACDFRVLRTGVEVEFWPHPGVARPEAATAVHEFWASAR